MDLSRLQNQTLVGRYRLEDQIGHGGCGVVFRGKQLSIGRRCAIKVLAPSLAKEDETIRRFQMEAKTTARLTHPNSIVIYDFGHDEEKNVLFLVMEFLEGVDLKTFSTNRSLSLTRITDIIYQSASSLREAHDKDLIHRDIKPSNIMLIDRNQISHFVKIIDFGIAKVLQPERKSVQSLTESGMIIGTPQYMAPEQIRDGPLDGRTDQYALAMTVYKLVTGTTPFQGSTAMEIASKQLKEPPPPLSTLDPDIDICRAFDNVLLRALSKNKDNRFPDITSFAESLKKAAQKETISAAYPKTSLQKDTVEPTDQRTVLESTAIQDVEFPEEPTVRLPGNKPSQPETSGSGWDFLPLSEDSLERPRLLSFALFSIIVVIGTAFAIFDSQGSTQTAPTKNPFSEKKSESAPPDRKGKKGGGSERSLAAQANKEAASPPKPEPSASKNPEASSNSNRAEKSSDQTKANGGQKAPASNRSNSGAHSSRDRSPAASTTPTPVRVRIIPWGTLYVDGREVGNKSRQSLKLKPGRHQFVVKQRGVPKKKRTLKVGKNRETIEFVLD